MNSKKLACPREEVIFYTGCSYEIPCFRTLGICSLQIQAEAGQTNGVKSTQNYCTSMNNPIMFRLGSPWAAKCWRVFWGRITAWLSKAYLPSLASAVPQVSIHPAHQIPSLPRPHPQTLLLWGSGQDSREQKKATISILEMNLEEKWWSVSWTWTWVQSEQQHLSVPHLSPVWCTISPWDSSWGIQEGRQQSFWEFCVSIFKEHCCEQDVNEMVTNYLIWS